MVCFQFEKLYEIKKQFKNLLMKSKLDLMETYFCLLSLCTNVLFFGGGGGSQKNMTTVKKNTNNSKGKFLSPSPITPDSEAHKKGCRVYLEFCFIL